MKKILTIILFQLVFNVAGVFAAADSEYVDFDFWKKFNDETLVNNLQKSIENNVDLKIATLKVKESEKIVKMSLASELPSIDFNGLAGKIFSSSDLRRGYQNYMIKSYTQTRFLLPFEVNYEIDIWGKNHLKTKSRKVTQKILQQDEKASYIILTTSLACDYYNLIRIDELLKLETKNQKLTASLLDLIEKREKIGLSALDDVLEVKSKLLQINSNINELIARKQIIENQIAYLMGEKFAPEINRDEFENTIEISAIPQDFKSEIILNRPDVVSAFENITRANYEARIAKKDLLPSFTITGTFGWNGYNNFKGIFKNHTGIAQVFVMPNLNIFDGGKKYQFMKLKQLELKEAQTQYEKAVLASLQEVNDNLAILKNENLNYKNSKDIFDIQTKKLNLKTNNKNFGLSSEIDTILYEQIQLNAKKQLANDKINQIISYINLYRCVGGYDFTKELL